ncbi:MAG: AraC family transcriptional regulator [Cyanobacteria bacterium J06636_16]
MTLRLTDEEFFTDQALQVEEKQQDPSDELDLTYKLKTNISEGWKREFFLRNDICLAINHYRPSDCLKVIYHSERELDEVKFSFALSADAQWNIASKADETSLPCKTGTYLIRSNGLTLYAIGDFPMTIPYYFVEVYVKPSLLYSFSASPTERIDEDLQDIIKPSDQEPYYLQTRSIQPEMTMVLQQILRCSYRGAIKRAYLESKAIELIALVLEHERSIKESRVQPGLLKSEQKERIYYAREILLKDLNHPPSLKDLAQQVGLSESALGKGFQQLFGTTIFAQLQMHRLEIAQQLLAEQDNSVAEVAHLIGYASTTSFSKAFKGKFGVGPKAYQKACR